MVSPSRPMFPTLGIRPPSDGRPHVLIIEQIKPGSPEMVYAPIGWWQSLSSCAVSVLNVWPLETFGGIPDAIDLTAFDAVIVCPRLAYDPVTLQLLDRRLLTPFVDYDGVKVLMRQDEHFMTRSIEDFVLGNGFDALVTCVPDDQVEVAYPRLGDAGVSAISVLTGYVSPDLRNVERAPYAERSIDLSYRAYRGGFSGGRLIHEKAEIGARALERLSDTDLKLDISLDPRDRLVGSDWREFLNDSRAVLGTESGSNLFDFTGEVFRWAALFNHAHSDASVEPGELYLLAREFLDPFEDNVAYAQVSPRHFEASAFGALQVMLPGRYSEIFRAGQHFIELARDFSNIDDVVAIVQDPALCTEITDRAVDEIIQNPKLWIETAIGRLDAAVIELIESRSTTAGAARPLPERREIVGGLIHMVVDGSTGLPDSLGGLAAPEPMVRVVVTDAERAVVSPGEEGLMTVAVGTKSSRPSIGFDRSGVEPLAQCFDRLIQASCASPGEIVRRFGGYTDRFGSLDRFRWDCRRALGLADEAMAWCARGLAPSAVVVSDAIGLLAGGVVNMQSSAPLIVDFETINSTFATMHGWQATFWEDMARELLSLADGRVVTGVSPSTLTAARSLFGHEAVLAESVVDGSGDGVLSRDRSGVSVASASDVEWVFTGERSHEAAPTLDDLQADVLPLVEQTYGLESTRFWNIVREATEDFRRRGLFGEVKDLLHYVLDRYVESARSEPEGSVRLELLDRRRSLLVRLISTSQSELSDEQARALAERVVNGDLPVSDDNRRSMWALAVRLRGGEERAVHDQFVRLLADTSENSADRVYGLLNLLAHDWSVEDYESARPVALELRDLEAVDEGVHLDENVHARIRFILGATGDTNS